MSPTARAVTLLTVFSFSALVVSPWFTAMLLVGVLLAFLVDAVAARAPEVDVSVPRELVRGSAAAFSIGVTPAPATRVRVRQPRTASVRFDPSEADGELRGSVLALDRGRHDVPAPVTRTRGPLGLADRTRRHGADHGITVHADLPGARRIAAAVRAGRFREPGSRRGPLGLGTDFETIRDYTPDDDIRRMNWLATERTGRPMVNQHREDTERDLWCLIDTGRLLASPVGDRTRLDLALDAVAAVAAVADVAGDRVGAVTFDDRIRRVIPPRRSAAAGLTRMLDDLEPSIVDSDHHGAFARITNEKRALVIVFTDILDGAASAPLLDALPILVRRHATLVAGVVDTDLLETVSTPPTGTTDLHRADLAAELLSERDRVRSLLTRAGAVVVDVRADDLPTSCVAAYLRLKASARL